MVMMSLILVYVVFQHVLLPSPACAAAMSLGCHGCFPG
jgi:hypothetical protein